MGKLTHIGDHTFWIRMPIDAATAVVQECGALGIPHTEFFRRCVALYFEVKDANADSPAPTLTRGQVEGSLSPSEVPSPVPDAGDEEKFRF